MGRATQIITTLTDKEKELFDKIYNIEDINFMVTLFCPGRCKYCSIWKKSKEEITKGEIDIKYFEKILTSYALRNTNYFDLTGGEVHLSPKYTEVVKLIGKYKPEAFIHTNISGWYPEVHERVVKEVLKYISKENYRIDISLDGSKVNYEKIRLVPNGYEKAIETAKRLKKYGIHLRFIMTIYKENYKDIEYLVELANELGIGYYFGYARESANYLESEEKVGYFTDEEIEYIEETLLKVGWLEDERRVPNWLWAKYSYQGFVPYFECYMGRMSLVIDPYGNIYPCNELHDFLFMGSLKEYKGDIDKLLISQEAIDALKRIERKECQPCSMLCAHKIEFIWGKQTGLYGREVNMSSLFEL